MKAITLEWLRKAESDFSDAHASGLSPDIICFLSQQCVEKYLKGYLEEYGISYPKTHDLELLMDLSLEREPLWESWRPAFATLTPYAAEFRYPGEWADKKDAKISLNIAASFREEMRSKFDIDNG